MRQLPSSQRNLFQNAREAFGLVTRIREKTLARHSAIYKQTA
jgi:hypothetical protein